MPRTYLAQITLHGISGIPSDVYMNSFHFRHPDDPSPTEWTDLSDAIIAFYNDTPASVVPGDEAPTGSVGAMLSGAVTQNNHDLRFYEVSAAPPRLPVVEVVWNLDEAPGVTALPEEVAICLSMKGDTVAGTDSGPGPHLPARHRNRTYIGPTRTAFLDFAESACRPSLQAQSRIMNAFAAMGDASITAGFRPEVWSPTRDAGEAVQTFWVDNAWDTQRRRGGQPTSRLSFTPAPAWG